LAGLRIFAIWIQGMTAKKDFKFISIPSFTGGNIMNRALIFGFFISLCGVWLHARDTDGSSNSNYSHGQPSYEPTGWNESVQGNWNQKQHKAYLARLEAEKKAKAAKKAAKAKTTKVKKK